MSFEDLLASTDKLLITDICPQKKDAFRFSIFINEKFAFGVSHSTYEEFQITKGNEISREIINEILIFEDFIKAKIDALNFIAKKMRSEWEIHIRLLKKGHSLEIIKKIILDFQDRKYLDDKEYAEVYVRDFINLKKEGVYKIRKNLQQKHIKREFVENAIEKYIDRDRQVEIAHQLAIKKMIYIQSKGKKKEKIYRFLSQKGFEGSVVSQVISDVFNNG